jgi:hypothetical protein
MSGRAWLAGWAVHWLGAVATVSAQVRAPVTARFPGARPLGPVVAITAEGLKSVQSVIELSSGRVVINDRIGRRLLLYDASLSTATVILSDTAPAAARRYGSGGPIFRFRGDTIIWVDLGSQALVVIRADGQIDRVLALRRPADIASLTSLAGKGSFDDRGDLAYRSTGLVVAGGLIVPAAGRTSPRDSDAIVRVGMGAGTVDTAGFVVFDRGPVNGMGMTTVFNPMLLVDDWAMLSDGAIAIVRGHDYHVDWLNPDGTRTSSPPIAHQWIRLTDSAKAALVDSIAAAQLIAGRGTPRPIVSPDVLPDYPPPFNSGAIIADADDHLWIRQAWLPSGQSGIVYDIVDRNGALVDRIQIPGGTTIAGFGHETVYLAAREGAGVTIARARIR